MSEVKKELSIAERGLLLAEIEKIKEMRNKILVERDKYDAEVTRLDSVVNALKTAMGD